MRLGYSRRHLLDTSTFIFVSSRIQSLARQSDYLAVGVLYIDHDAYYPPQR